MPEIEAHFDQSDYDVVVAGSGSAGLSTALRAAVGGLRVAVFEKTDVLGGTSAMSGAGTWTPANHHALAAGIADSIAEAIEYIRAVCPSDWKEEEDELWVAFTRNAPRMLRFLEEHTPLRFALSEEPDIMAERSGGKTRGRMLSPRPLRKAIVGSYASRIRRSTLPHLFTYQEVYDGDLYHRPARAALRFGPRVLWRLLTNSRAQGSALVVGLLRGCLDSGCHVETNSRVVELLTDAEKNARDRSGRRIQRRATYTPRPQRRGYSDGRIRVERRDAESLLSGAARPARQPSLQ